LLNIIGASRVVIEFTHIIRITSHTKSSFRTYGLSMSVSSCATGLFSRKTKHTYDETRNHLSELDARL
jgi:hypothetical protein